MPRIMPCVIYISGLLIAEGLRLPHRIRRLRSGKSWHPPNAASIGGFGETIVLAAVLIGIWILPGIYIFTPWLTPFDYTLPGRIMWPAIAVFTMSIILRWKAQTTLGQAWSHTTELSDQHPLITDGLYSKIRHPLYASLILWAVAQLALLPNWIAGLAGPIAVALIWLIRVPAEEAMMRARFGEDYLQYSSRTGRLIPKRK